MFNIYRSEEALAPLSGVWERADAPLREAIMAASRRIDQQLHVDPQEQGESRENQSRILFEAPLGVIYEVDEEKKLVRILRAWMYRCAISRGERTEPA
jgi:hypothetical protein